MYHKTTRTREGRLDPQLSDHPIGDHPTGEHPIALNLVHVSRVCPVPQRLSQSKSTIFVRISVHENIDGTQFRHGATRISCVAEAPPTRPLCMRHRPDRGSGPQLGRVVLSRLRRHCDRDACVALPGVGACQFCAAAAVAAFSSEIVCGDGVNLLFAGIPTAELQDRRRNGNRNQAARYES